MKQKILIWILNKIFNTKNKQLLCPYIKKLYREIAEKNLNIKTEIIKVKKGKKRYNLVFFETPKGKLKFNLGRHWEDKGVKKELI